LDSLLLLAKKKNHPALLYKLSTAGKQDEAIRLGSDADWAGCREEVISAEKDKRKSISVKIIVADQVSLTHFSFPVFHTLAVPSFSTYEARRENDGS
jgi:hypothetical protein